MMRFTYTRTEVRLMLRIATATAAELRAFAARCGEDAGRLEEMAADALPPTDGVLKALDLQRAGAGFVWKVEEGRHA